MLGAFAADLEELGRVTGEDVVAGGQTSVAGEDGEGGAGDAEGGAAVVGVGVEGVLGGGAGGADW